ncbi:hypothetical protein ZWY2020_016797 [Hordeum vulgare]|nr:hypothetical protein ZWY2020_016797 [Hordeum vulgare]
MTTRQRSSDVPPSPKRRHRSSDSGIAQMSWTAGAVSLPDEIIFDILTRVPVNSACRFRCVSREWDALISDPDFVAAHKSRHAEPLVAVYSFREEPSKGTELRLVDMDGNAVRVIKVKDGGGSSSSRLPRHDLICVTDDHSGACLVDPVTGDLLVTCPCPRTTNAEFVMCFGRAVPSGAYKVLCFFRDGWCHHVLALTDGLGWRPTRLCPTRVACYPGSAAVVNGILHILAMVGVLGDKIHCFDLESEEWTKTIQGPHNAAGRELWRKTTTTVRVAELNAILCMVQSEVRLINVWLLTDSHNSKWVKAYTIPTDLHTYLHTPLRMTHGGGRLLFRCFRFGGRAQMVRSYDPCTNACTHVIKAPGNLSSKISICNLHLESFISNKI